MPPIKFLSPKVNKKFHVITQWKLHFIYSRCSCTTFILTSYFVYTGHANFGFIDVQYLQNVVFSIEIRLNGPNHSSTDFHHPMKKSLLSPKFPTSPLPPNMTGDFPPTPLMLIWKTLVCYTFPSRGVEIISTYFSVWLRIVNQFDTLSLTLKFPY